MSCAECARLRGELKEQGRELDDVLRRWRLAEELAEAVEESQGDDPKRLKDALARYREATR